ncbi:MAG: hypothetical protein BWY47_00696 [Bacteroidetes bacterium ADurb.Bin302]|nr:MAG: hypothetical protein BWY47_00696 [Bacteroidetes bacterium ADurb.Bin302]
MSEIIKRADLNAVSPEVIGAAITPNIASKPPKVPSQSFVMLFTISAAFDIPIPFF